LTVAGGDLVGSGPVVVVSGRPSGRHRCCCGRNDGDGGRRRGGRLKIHLRARSGPGATPDIGRPTARMSTDPRMASSVAGAGSSGAISGGRLAAALEAVVATGLPNEKWTEADEVLCECTSVAGLLQRGGELPVVARACEFGAEAAKKDVIRYGRTCRGMPAQRRVIRTGRVASFVRRPYRPDGRTRTGSVPTGTYGWGGHTSRGGPGCARVVAGGAGPRHRGCGIARPRTR